ncbi:hypothetical protein BSNK01_12010 [Bacillaceae bacterium]
MLNFGEALEALKQGKKVKRKQWGGYWFIPQVHVTIQDKERTGYEVALLKPLIVARLKDDEGYVSAQPYQVDLLAEDWEVIE